MSAEYIVAHGNPNVMLCERGIRTFETATRNTCDIAAVPVLHELSHLPVVLDPSHATGKRSLVPAAGAGGGGHRGRRRDRGSAPVSREGGERRRAVADRRGFPDDERTGAVHRLWKQPRGGAAVAGGSPGLSPRRKAGLEACQRLKPTRRSAPLARQTLQRRARGLPHSRTAGTAPSLPHLGEFHHLDADNCVILTTFPSRRTGPGVDPAGFLHKIAWLIKCSAAGSKSALAPSARFVLVQGG